MKNVINFADDLRSEYCRLELLDPEVHGKDLYDAFSCGSDWTYLAYGPFSDYQTFCDWLVSVQLDPEVQFYAILTDKAQGLVSFMRIIPEHRVIEIGHIHFSKKLKQTTAATAALYLMLCAVFEKIQFRRCEWKCDAQNIASINAAKRLGFVFEGIFRQHMIFKSRNRDTAWFSIIDQEWPSRKACLQKWLAKSNFDSQGHQIKKLAEF